MKWLLCAVRWLHTGLCTTQTVPWHYMVYLLHCGWFWPIFLCFTLQSHTYCFSEDLSQRTKWEQSVKCLLNSLLICIVFGLHVSYILRSYLYVLLHCVEDLELYCCCHFLFFFQIPSIFRGNGGKWLDSTVNDNLMKYMKVNVCLVIKHLFKCLLMPFCFNFFELL